MEPQPQPVHLEARLEVKGMVMPAWFCMVLIGAFVLAVATMLIGAATISAQTREMRVLELHVQDIESVLIRAGIARRSDFAAWVNGQVKARDEQDSDSGAVSIKPHTQSNAGGGRR
jgi:hypothetical protein